MRSLLSQGAGRSRGKTRPGGMSPTAPIPTFQERMVGIKVRHGLKPRGGLTDGCAPAILKVAPKEETRYGSLKEEGDFKGMRNSTSLGDISVSL